jgi:hypothetical protein
MEPGCIGKSNTNNLLESTDETFLFWVSQKSATMVESKITLES